MTAQTIIHKVQELALPPGSFIVFGSCPMAAVGIRESQDIDLFITEETDALLHRRGWQRVDSKAGDLQLEYAEFDTHTNWHIGSYNPSLQGLLATAMVIDDVPFGALEEVKAWKSVLGRSKDIADIALIDAFLGSSQA